MSYGAPLSFLKAPHRCQVDELSMFLSTVSFGLRESASPFWGVVRSGAEIQVRTKPCPPPAPQHHRLHQGVGVEEALQTNETVDIFQEEHGAHGAGAMFLLNAGIQQRLLTAVASGLHTWERRRPAQSRRPTPSSRPGFAEGRADTATDSERCRLRPVLTGVESAYLAQSPCCHHTASLIPPMLPRDLGSKCTQECKTKQPQRNTPRTNSAQPAAVLDAVVRVPSS